MAGYVRVSSSYDSADLPFCEAESAEMATRGYPFRQLLPGEGGNSFRLHHKHFAWQYLAPADLYHRSTPEKSPKTGVQFP
jgi:hypothetical protein